MLGNISHIRSASLHARANGLGHTQRQCTGRCRHSTVCAIVGGPEASCRHCTVCAMVGGPEASVVVWWRAWSQGGGWAYHVGPCQERKEAAFVPVRLHRQQLVHIHKLSLAGNQNMKETNWAVGSSASCAPNQGKQVFESWVASLLSWCRGFVYVANPPWARTRRHAGVCGEARVTLSEQMC